MVFCRVRWPQPLTLGDQVSSDAAYNEQQKIRVEEESCARHLFKGESVGSGP